MDFILIAVAVLGAIGLIAALVLYVCSKKFAVYEDPRIAQVTEQLPGANCGGCGFAGCGGLADALVKGADTGSLEGLMCPVGGQEVMGKVADLLGMAIANGEPMVAVVRCNGTCEHRPMIAAYSGLRTCAACKVAGYCNAAESKEKIVDVFCSLAAQKLTVGQTVTVTASRQVATQALLWAFGLPFLLMVSVLIMILKWTGSEGLAALSGLGVLIPYYIVLWLFRGRMRDMLAFTIE